MDDDLKRRPMRIAAGGLLLLAALFNLSTGVGDLLKAGLLAGMGDALGGKFATGADAFSSIGGLASGDELAIFGGFFLIGGVVLIIGAVCVLSARHAPYIYTACAVAIVSSLAGVWLTSFGLTKAVGIAGGGLGFISGLRVQLTADADDTGTGSALDRQSWLAGGIIVAGLVLLIGAIYLWRLQDPL